MNPSFLLGRGEPPTKCSKIEGVTGVAGKEGSGLFQGGCSFYITNKIKSKIFNDKKEVYKQKCFSLQ